tara:strand:+ start:313 stop:1257 length:945 start_codon:yes stop_codon:yes gene_type:complete
MADTKISALTSASTPLAGTEVLPIVQSSTTVKVATNDLTVRNVRANATTGILQVTGPTAATTRVATVPDANFTVARTDAAQTFTGTQQFTGAIMGGSSNVNFEILGTSAYSAVLVGLGIARASKISPTDDSGYVGWLFSSQTDTFSTSTQLPSDGATFADRFKVNGISGDATLYTGNLVPGTAAKGVNFTANTPAAGMTSQLLNWYEEGTWTPVPSSLTVVGATSYAGTYIRVGKLVMCTVAISAATSTVSTANTTTIGGLPFSASSIGSVGFANYSTLASYGVGAVNGTLIYPPSWTTGAGQQAVASFSYRTT